MEQSHLREIARRIRNFAEPGDHHSLRPHQVEMLGAVAAHLENGHSNGTVKAATGTGKTYAIGALAVASDEPTVIITPRNLIGTQTLNTFMDPEKFQINKNDVGIYDAARPPTERRAALKKKILITTYPSFISLAKSGRISADPNSPAFRKNIILDEAHRATGFEFSQQLQPFVDHSMITGWTATDTFKDGSRVDDRLFGSKERIYTLDLPKAVREGLLVDAIHPLGVEVGVDAEDIERLKRSNQDYPEAAIERFAKMAAVQEEAVKTYMNYVDSGTGIAFRGLPCVVNTMGIQAAEQTARRFNKALGTGAAVAISGHTKGKEKERILKDFEAGKIKVLCAADLLIEGFDSKDVSLVFSLRPSTSPWLVEQMLGRGARQQSSGYFERYGHDKQLFAVNFFGQGMKPLLFSEITGDEGVLKSTKHTPRKPHSATTARDGSYTPYLPPAGLADIQSRIFATTTQYKSLRREWGEAPERSATPRIREAHERTSDLPYKPGHMLGFTEFCIEASISMVSPKRQRIREIFDACEAQFDDPRWGKKPVIYEGVEVDCGRFQGRGPAAFCLSEKMVDVFAPRVPPKPGNMLVLAEFCEKASVSPDSPKGQKIREIFNACEKQFDNPKRKKPITYNEIEVSCARFRSGSHEVFCLNETMVEKFVPRVPEKPDGMLGVVEFCAEARIDPRSPNGQKVRDIFVECEKQFDDPKRKGKPIKYEGVEINCGRFKHGKYTGFYLHKDIAARLFTPIKPEHMLGHKEFCAEASVAAEGSNGVKIKEIFEACEKQFDNPKRTKSITYNRVEVSCGRYKSGSQIVFCLDKKMVEKFMPRLPSKPEHMLGYTEFCGKAGASLGTVAADRIKEIFEVCEKQFVDTKRKDKPVKYEGVEIHCGHYRKGPSTVFCLDETMIQKLNLATRPKPDHMLGLKKFCQEAGGSLDSALGEKIRAIFAACEKQFDDPKRKDGPVTYAGVEVSCGRFKSGGHIVFCIDNRHVRVIKAIAEKELAAPNDIPAQSLRGIKPKSLAPDSPDMKRTGKTR